MKIVGRELLDRLTVKAAASPRRRANENLHPALEDPIQRFLNAFEPETYVRPHRHAEPPRWELFLALRGRAAVLLFNEEGCVVERVELSAGGELTAVELSASGWHTVVALEQGTVLFEVKPGPYSPTTDKDFATWAPVEGEASCGIYERWFRAARLGDGPEEARCAQVPEATPCR
jgi:cupin fold WbuC family metalloprotein